MAAERKDEDIIKIGLEHNVGDLPLGMSSGQKRDSVTPKMNVCPGDLINRNHPENNYQFSWCPFTDEEFWQDLKDDGYAVAVESEWISNRWEWNEPEVKKPRWNAMRMLTYRDCFLMYRNEDLWAQEMANRAVLNDNSIRRRTDDSVENALMRGVSVEGEIGGQKFKQNQPSRRPMVVMGS